MAKPEAKTSMHVIWKRPDGFHGASPSDFSVLELEGHSRLWLHKKDKDQYPFRISGGWEEGEATVRLNNLINLLPQSKEKWVEYLTSSFNHSLNESPKEFFDEMIKWLKDLKAHLKGDTWEIEILDRAIDSTAARLDQMKPDFVKRAGQ